MDHQFFHWSSFVLVQVHHPLYYFEQLLRVLTGYPLYLPLFYLHSQLYLIGGLERSSQSGDLVYHAASWPNVALLIVLLLWNLFRGHVIGSAYVSVGIYWLVTHYSGKAEVAQFNIATAVQEDIAWLEVSVQDLSFFPMVAFVESDDHLRQYFPYLIFL